LRERKKSISIHARFRRGEGGGRFLNQNLKGRGGREEKKGQKPPVCFRDRYGGGRGEKEKGGEGQVAAPLCSKEKKRDLIERGMPGRNRLFS